MKTVVYVEVQHLVLGAPALVRTLNHPDTDNVRNGYWNWTSPVQALYQDGKTFRTMNTLYRPLPNLAPGESHI